VKPDGSDDMKIAVVVMTLFSVCVPRRAKSNSLLIHPLTLMKHSYGWGNSVFVLDRVKHVMFTSCLKGLRLHSFKKRPIGYIWHAKALGSSFAKDTIFLGLAIPEEHKVASDQYVTHELRVTHTRWHRITT
jgi:hypothetical protein